MDQPPAEKKPSAEQDDTPEPLDADLRRVLLRAAETCRDRFDEDPSRSTYQLSAILDALGRYPHLIDAVHRFMASDKCPSKTGAAPVVKVGAIDVRRLVRNKEGEPVVRKDGSVVYQKVQGRPWEGPSMVNVTRWAIDEFNADPLDVATVVVRHLPPLLRADCRDANRDPDQVGLDIADLLADDGTGKSKQGWRDPEAVLRAILKELGHPRPGNVTR